MENLPIGITESILSGLPMVSQLQCREVCKTWRSLVPKPKKGLIYGVSHRKAGNTNQRFFFLEQKKRVNDDDEHLCCLGPLTKLDHELIIPASNIFRTFMVGSCKGLVCYAGCTSSMPCERTFYICNPVTREQIQLPAIPWKCNANSERAIGFGYNRSSKEFKVVRILLDNDRYRDGMIQVYTLQGGAEWRSKSRISEKRLLSYLGNYSSAGVFAGGSLHWINEYNVNPKTVAFDLEHETIELIPPVHSVIRDDKHVGLMELGGSLCLLEIVPSKHVTIWELKYREIVKYKEKQGGYVSNWVLKLNILWKDYSWFEPFALSKRDKCLLWYNVVLVRDWLDHSHKG